LYSSSPFFINVFFLFTEIWDARFNDALFDVIEKVLSEDIQKGTGVALRERVGYSSISVVRLLSVIVLHWFVHLHILKVSLY